MKKHVYGNRPPDIGERAFGLGWLSGVRHIVYRSAKASHWHEHPELALLFCLRGEYTYEFRDRSPVTLSAGSFLAFPRGLVHRHSQAIDPVGLRLEMLIRPERTGQGSFGVLSSSALAACVRRIFDEPLQVKPCTRAVLADIRRLDALSARGERKLNALDLARARLLASSILIGCSHGEREPEPALQPVRMDEIVSWMEARLSEKFSIERLVAHVGYSRTHVFTLFRKATGLTPADYLTRLRIRKARELLRSTDLSAAEIAAACGFATPSAFNAVFKRTTGVTPISWRRT